MKKWREIFGITQAELGDYLKISPSTISDYEGNRRKSPGIGVVRRFVDALLTIDQAKGGNMLEKLLAGQEKKPEDYYELHEFATSITGTDFLQLVKGKAIANEELLSKKKVYGYTLINSLKVILDMPSAEFPRLYGTMSERAFVFTQVSTGRSPLVVVRIWPMKPSIIVLHKLEEKRVDKLALKIAHKEQIPVITTTMSIEEMAKELNRL